MWWTGSRVQGRTGLSILGRTGRMQPASPRVTAAGIFILYTLCPQRSPLFLRTIASSISLLL